MDNSLWVSCMPEVPGGAALLRTSIEVAWLGPELNEFWERTGIELSVYMDDDEIESPEAVAVGLELWPQALSRLAEAPGSWSDVVAYRTRADGSRGEPIVETANASRIREFLERLIEIFEAAHNDGRPILARGNG